MLALIQSDVITAGLGVVAMVLIWVLYVNRNRRTPPGPITFPIVGNLNTLLANNGDVLKTFRNLRQKYGDLFTLKMGSYDTVVLNGYENMKELLSKQGDEVSDRPDAFVFKEVVKGHGLAGSSGSLWKTHRTFALTTLRSFGFGKRSIENRILQETSMLMQEIESKNGKPFDLNDKIQASISNIICSIVFGQRFEYSDERFIKLVRTFNENLSLAGPSAFINVFPFLKHVPGDPFKGKLILKNSDKLEEFLGELVKEHSETYDEDNIRDYIDAYLKEQKKDRDTFTDLQLIQSIGDLFIAGTETTATTIKWAVLYLLHHPDVQSKLRKEIDNVIGASRTPSLEDRVNLPYCQAFITEVLRCGNIAPLSLQHSCQKDVSFKGYRIPKGTIIIPNLDSVMNDEHVFKNPNKFDPERFIDENGKFYGHEKVVAFSVGRRVCLGESLARSELFLILTSMIQRFSFVAKDKNNLPPTEGVLGIARSPKPFKFCAVKRD